MLDEIQPSTRDDEEDREEIRKLIDIIGFCSRAASNLRKSLSDANGDDIDHMHNAEDALVLEMLLESAIAIVETNSFTVEAARR